MAFGMQDYEQEIAACKRRLFMELFQSEVEDLLEVGMGTGPNLKYYKQRQVCCKELQATTCCNYAAAQYCTFTCCNTGLLQINRHRQSSFMLYAFMRSHVHAPADHQTLQV